MTPTGIPGHRGTLLLPSHALHPLGRPGLRAGLPYTRFPTDSSDGRWSLPRYPLRRGHQGELWER